MTAEEKFEAWWANNVKEAYTQREVAKQAWLDCTEKTARRCVEICRENYGQIGKFSADIIEREFGVGK